MIKPSVTFLIPDLLPLCTLPVGAVDFTKNLPYMTTLISKASLIKGMIQTEGKPLSNYFQGLPHTIPTGALSALGQNEIDVTNKDFWCQVTPFEYEVDHRTVYALGNTHLQLNAKEWQTLTEELNVFLKEDELILKMSAGNWLCKVPKYTEATMQDFSEIIGKSLYAYLPEGKDSAYWRRLLTECQMLLSQTKVNKQRQATQQNTVSSLWFWGLSQLPADITSSLTQIISDDPVLHGLGKMANVPAHGLSASYHFSSNTLIVDYQTQNLFKMQQYKQWYQRLAYFEKNWFKPLYVALKKGELAQIIIIHNTNAFKVTQRHLKYFWRKSLSLEQIMKKNIK